MSKRDSTSGRLAFLLVLAAVLLVGNMVSCGKTPDIARLTILYSGDIEGFLKNCGCSGGQVGGEKRKARLMKIEREEALKSLPTDKGRPAEALVLDTGNFANNEGDVWKLYTEGVVKSMELINYDVVGLGHNELKYPQDELWGLIGNTGMPFTAANLRFVKPRVGADKSKELNGLLKKFRIIKMPSGFRVGVIHVVDTNLDQKIKDDNGIELDNAPDVAKAILRDNKRKADMWILTAASTLEKGINMTQIAQLTDLTIVIGFHGTNPLQPANATSVVYPYFLNRTFAKAKSVGKAVVSFSTHKERGRYRFIINSEQKLLNASINPDPDVAKIISDLEPELEDLELESTRERLANAEPPPHYIGHQECAMCHQQIYDFLQHTRHVNAYESLAEKKQERSAACLRCHVTGHGSTSGWNILQEDEKHEFEGVTCESCHGPGSYHAEAMAALAAGQDYTYPDDFSKDGRNAVGLRDVNVETCRTCHDPVNSVEFSYSTYYPKIDHTNLAERGVTAPPHDEDEGKATHGGEME